ncbi:MAG: aspartate ammonia-lyase, partial [Cyanobacteria bacterium]|nr:aspartate ammonia-lyase [Cyanobacteriota bacterium]
MAQESKAGSTRTELDSLGEVQVPAAVYWGASTQRAVENFPISGLRLPQEFIRALAVIKRSSAEANTDLGLLGSDIASAIVRACDEVLAGNFDSQFVVDVFQTGSGTSTNMNMNEVLARRAREHLGRSADDRNSVHPNDHVNLGQSSNDVIPSALHLSALLGIEDKLLPALKVLEASLANKARQFRTVV